MRKVKFIYNPFSGENKILNSLDFIISSYQLRDYQIVPYRLSKECKFEDSLKGVDDTYDHILISGGDGTVNGVVNAMKQLDITTPIALLPAGTANDFAGVLGCGGSIKRACLEILDGVKTSVDLGVVNGKYFVNVLSSGLLTEISQRTSTIFKNNFGKLAYYMSSLGELPNFKKIHIRIDSHDLIYDDTCLLIFVFNGRTAGNFSIAHNSDLNDGLLDVLVIKGDNIAETISAAFHFFTRITSDYPRGVVHFKTNQLTVRSDDNITVDIDGESAPGFPLDISCIKGGLNVIVSKSYFKK